jgi:hypothetical protein
MKTERVSSHTPPELNRSPTTARAVSSSGPILASQGTIRYFVLGARCANIGLRPISGTRSVMNAPTPRITAPSISHDGSIWFSAYAFGWGYCAFSIPTKAVCEQLGAADTSAKQLMLAFELGKAHLQDCRGNIHTRHWRSGHAKQITLLVPLTEASPGGVALAVNCLVLAQSYTGTRCVSAIARIRSATELL